MSTTGQAKLNCSSSRHQGYRNIFDITYKLQKITKNDFHHEAKKSRNII